MPKDPSESPITSSENFSENPGTRSHAAHPPEPSNHFAAPPSPKVSARKRPASETRIQANRQNALRSTGPKTARGKRTVSRNAIKHGVLARAVVITAGDGVENKKEFYELLRGLKKCYEPVGDLEENIVQIIATCLWRKARVLRAENGEIRKRLDTLAVDRDQRNSDKTNLALVLDELDLGWYRRENQTDLKVSTRDRWSAMQVQQTNLRGHHLGLDYLSGLLKIAKSEIDRDGYMSEEIRNKIFIAFCFWDGPFALVCRYSGPSQSKMKDSPSE